MQVLRFDLGPSLHRRNGLKNSIMSGMSGAAPAYHTRATPGSAAAVAIVARAAGACALLLVSTWVHGLGGVSSTRASDGGTDALFNWHPVLMTLAYAVFMTEALLAYKAPWQRDWARPQRKRLHWAAHSAALTCAVLGVTAAWRSHTLKLPTPIPNLYSPHSFLGVTALLLLAGQYGVGFVYYLWPQMPMEARAALSPLHQFWGLATYGAGMAAAASGLQEKATFLQAFGKRGVRSAAIQLPAATELALLCCVLTVLWVHAAPGQAVRHAQPQQPYSALGADELERGTAS